MIVSTVLPGQRIVPREPSGLDNERRGTRCSLELLSNSTDLNLPSTTTSRMGGSTSSRLPTLMATHNSSRHTNAMMREQCNGSCPLSLSPSTSSCSEEEGGALSSPASSGYGRSATSEGEEPSSPDMNGEVNGGRSEGTSGFFSSDIRMRRSTRKSTRRMTSGAVSTTTINASFCDGDISPSSRLPPHPMVMTVGRLLAEDDVQVLESLGEGFFSVVHKVRVRGTGEILVRKVAKTDVRGDRRTTHSDVNKEADMLRKLQHPNVLALRGMCVAVQENGEWDLHLLVDYCAGGSLSRLLLNTNMSFPWSRRISYATDIAAGMAHIHSKRVIHRDLTSMNVLLENGNGLPPWGKAVIADFGLSCAFPRPNEKLSQVGTTYFMSPECLKEQYYDEKSDVYSFGIILCQLIARIDADPEFGLHRTADFGLNYVLFTSYCPPDTPIGLLTLAFSCCLMDPRSRPSFADTLIELRKLRELCGTEQIACGGERSGSPCDYDSSPLGGRLERSRSDAAIRRPKAVHQRKFSAYRSTVRPLTEGVAESSFAAAEEAAGRDAACRETVTRPIVLRGAPCIGGGLSPTRRTSENSPLNPFASHARFRRERKIVPHRESENERRRSEREGRDEVDIGDATRIRRNRLMRRCSSLPSEMDIPPPSFEWLSSDEYSDTDDIDDDLDATFDTTCAGAIPMAFRDCDQRFLRQSKRFSRRYLMVNASSSSSSAVVVPSTTNVFPPPSTVSLSPSPSATTVLSIIPSTVPLSDTPRSTSYSPATGDRLNNNLDSDASSAQKHSTWPKRKESRVRQDEGYGICRSRNATASRGGRQACSIL